MPPPPTEKQKAYANALLDEVILSKGELLIDAGMERLGRPLDSTDVSILIDLLLAKLYYGRARLTAAEYAAMSPVPSDFRPVRPKRYRDEDDVDDPWD